MEKHKFWGTQPVPAFNDGAPTVEEPIKLIQPDNVPDEPAPLVEGFEWATLDILKESELKEIYNLLALHYVEDNDSMFRFNYSYSFLRWALEAPGWKAVWHVGVRASTSKKLVGFISGIPVSVRIRKETMRLCEINFLCVHKKVRSNRLAPVLIKEITRRCYKEGIFQAIYTAGILLPTPISTCQYFHRCLNWQKLYEVGFSALPMGSTVPRQLAKFKLPSTPGCPGFRPMKHEDGPAVCKLLNDYLRYFDLAQQFDQAEFNHWFLSSADAKPDDKVVWAYVVEDPSTNKTTDFISFFCLESTVIGNRRHKHLRAAYMYYYATDAIFLPDPAKLKTRLNQLVGDILITAKNDKFDVFNALALLHNPLFLEGQKFGPGDGQLHYYLFNYRVAPFRHASDLLKDGGDGKHSGIGMVML